MDRTTPCTEWSVRDVITHVVESNVWVAQLLTTGDYETIDVPSDVVGTDALAAWEESAAQITQGFAGDLARRVRHPLGDTPIHRLLFFRVSDHLVHAWDLARALGTDEGLDPQAVRICLDVLDPVALMLPATGMFAPPLPAATGADEQAQLLAILGRS